jgi:diaminopimelate decarboxylase
MDTYQELAELTEQYGSPFYIFDEEAFIRNFEDIRAEFTKRFPSVIIGYSYKTNYIPYVCRLVRKMGGYAEVVSRLELDLALRIGCPPNEIIYNGPIKSADDIAYALNSGVIVNIDNMRELEFVTNIARQQPERLFRIGLRINIVLDNSHLLNEMHFNRFGFSEDTIETAAQLLREFLNVRVCSLHGHSSSSDRGLQVYHNIATSLAEVGKQYFSESIEFLNVGGGFYGRWSAPAMGLVNTPTFTDYAETIYEVLHQYAWVETRQPRMIIEPGMAVVADTLTFFTRVFEVKKIRDEWLAVVDGSVFNTKPTLHQHNNPFSVIKKAIATGPKKQYNIVGSTCMEKDRLLKDIESVEIERDDFIRIDNVGAYTVVMIPPFINPAPPILVRDKNGYMAIRRRQDFNDIFDGYLF